MMGRKPKKPTKPTSSGHFGDAASITTANESNAPPPRRPWFVAALLLATLLTLASGLLHGRMTRQWGTNPWFSQVAQQLQAFPAELGPWQQEGTFELSKRAQEMLECQGYFSRGYRNRETGDYIRLAVMVGPGAKMSIHVPEICFEASNFTLLGPRHRFQLDAAGQQHDFWSVMFRLNDASQRPVRVLYGWSSGGPWTAPRRPRWSVAGHRVLYKLQLSYVVNDLPTADPAASDEVVRAFLHDAVTALRPLLGPYGLGPAGDTSGQREQREQASVSS